MKKILIVSLSIMLYLSAQAHNYTKLTQKSYIDFESIRRYQNKALKDKSSIFSFWTKTLNDNRQEFIDVEKDYDKKISYMEREVLINCKQKKLAVKAIKLYDLDENLIENKEFSLENQPWVDVIPKTLSEAYFSYICKQG